MLGKKNMRVKGLVRPEDTRGGALMAGLSFCADDRKEQCPGVTPPDQKERFHGTQSAFWAGVYREFAKRVTGRLLVAVLDSDAQMYLSIKAAIPYLRPDVVSEVDLFLVHDTCANSQVVANVSAALTQVGISNFTCTADPYLLKMALCAGSLATKDSCDLAQVVEKSQTLGKQATTNIDGDYHEMKAANTTSFPMWVKCFLIAMAAFAILYLVENQEYHKGYDEIPQTETRASSIEN